MTAAAAGKVVLGLTTTPARISKVVLPTLHSLLNQSRPADRVILSVPEQLARTGERFPAIPTAIQALADEGRIEIHRTGDHGPATKFVGAMRAEQDPQAMIAWCDDDILYGPAWLQTLAEELRGRPNTALGICGFTIVGTTGYGMVSDHGGHAEILEGFGGVICRRGDLPGERYWPAMSAEDFSRLDDWRRARFLQDDYVMCYALRARGIKTEVCSTPTVNRDNAIHVRPEGLGQDALMSNRRSGGHFGAYALLKDLKFLDEN